MTTIASKRLAAGVGWVSAGAMLANIAAYLLQLLAGRWLGPDGYSEFASLLAVQLLLAISAFAVQAVVARELVRGVDWRVLQSLSLRCVAVIAGAALIAIPIVAIVLRTSVMAAAGALVVAPMLVAIAARQGILQGSSEFRRLGGVLGSVGLMRVVPPIVALSVGADIAVALWCGAVGTLLVALVLWFLPHGELASTFAAPQRATVLAVLRAGQAQSALIALSLADVVLARIVLTERLSSIYALGAIVAKVALWLPNAVGLVLYPQMARPQESAKAKRLTLIIVGAIGACSVVGAAVCAPLLPVLAGDAYVDVVELAWIFAIQGALLAVIQAGLLAVIAQDQTRVAAVVWALLVAEIGLVLVIQPGVSAIIAIAAVTAAVAAIVVVVAALASDSRH